MELRSDIAAAATRMTSGYDVNREIRHLGAYLREGETVQRLTSGLYGAGTGLLAVTDHRVFLLRDGRSGQASEGFPLERLSTVEWMAEGVRGTITISDSNSIAELRDVTSTDGEEIVGYVRALISANIPPPHGRRWGDQTMSNTAPSIPVVRVTPTQAAPPHATPPRGLPVPPPPGLPAQTAYGREQATPPRGMPTQGTPGPGMPVQPAAAQHAAPGSTADALTRGAVPVTLLSRPNSIPSQPPPVEPPATGESTTGLSTTGPGVAVPGAGSSTGPAIGLPGASVSPTGVAGTTPTSAVPAGAASTTAMPTTALSAPAVPTTARPATGAPAGAVPTAGVPPTQVGPSGPERAGVIGSQPLIIGEVPVSQLAAEGSGTFPALAEVPADPNGVDPTAAANAVGDAEQTGDRPRPILWRMPSQKSSTPTKTTESRTTNLRPPVRVEATAKPSNAGPGRGPAGRKKWIWLGAGAAGLIGLAAIGSAQLISPNQPRGAAPVSPVPAVVDSTAGPVVTVAKVIDGDTVEVTGQEVNGPVEVLGIVAPRLDKNQCGAATSKAYAVRTLNNTQVTLVTDPSQPATNRAGHKLAFLRLPNGADYSVMAVGAGMARYYESPQPVGTANEIKAAEAAAQGKHEGLWGPPCNLKPTAAADTVSPNSGTGSGASTSSGTGSGASTSSGIGGAPANPVASTNASSQSGN